MFVLHVVKTLMPKICTINIWKLIILRQQMNSNSASVTFANKSLEMKIECDIIDNFISFKKNKIISYFFLRSTFILHRLFQCYINRCWVICKLKLYKQFYYIKWWEEWGLCMRWDDMGWVGCDKKDRKI